MDQFRLGSSFIRNEPIQLLAAQARYAWDASRERPDLRWPFHRAIFEARMNMIREMVENDMVSVADPTIDVIVRATQRCIPASVTGGKDIRLPECNTHFSYIVGEHSVW